jgi:hypothetical protein
VITHIFHLISSQASNTSNYRSYFNFMSYKHTERLGCMKHEMATSLAYVISPLIILKSEHLIRYLIIAHAAYLVMILRIWQYLQGISTYLF